MNSYLRYYELFTTSLDSTSMDKGAEKIAYQTWVCPGCYAILPGMQSIDVVVQCKGPSNRTPLNIVWGYGIRLAKKDFLAQFGWNFVEKNFFIGKVFLENRNLLDNWVTCRSKHPQLIMRGKKKASHRKCEICNRNIYFAMPPFYLYPPPPPDIEIFESDMNTLIVTEPLLEKIDRKKFRIRATQLPVLDTPKDGFTELISVY